MDLWLVFIFQIFLFPLVLGARFLGGDGWEGCFKGDRFIGELPKRYVLGGGIPMG